MKLSPVYKGRAQQNEETRQGSGFPRARKLRNLFKRKARDEKGKFSAIQGSTANLSEIDPLLTPSPRRSSRIAVQNDLNSLSPLVNYNLFPISNKGFDASLRTNLKGEPAQTRDVVASYMRSLKPFPVNEGNRSTKIVVRTGIRDLNSLAEELNSKATITHARSVNNNLACCGEQTEVKRKITKSCSAGDIKGQARAPISKRSLFIKQRTSSGSSIGVNVAEKERIGMNVAVGGCDTIHEFDQDVPGECCERENCSSKDRSKWQKEKIVSDNTELKRSKSSISRKIFGSLFENKL